MDFSTDVSKFLQEISPDEPCGENLEYDAQFLEFEQATKGKPEVQYGDTITPEEPPDWKQVKSLAQQLMLRSCDLRIAVPYTRALLKLQGFAGLATGLVLIEQMLEQRWEHLHPQLDPDDDNDPMLRVNTLAALREQSTFLRDVREAYLVSSRSCGRFGLREIDIAIGEIDPPAGTEKTSMAVIEAAFQDVSVDENQAMLAAVSQAFDSVARIDAILTEKIGASQSLDLSPLSKNLKRARDFVTARLHGTGATSAPVTDSNAPQAAGVAVQYAPAVAPISGDIRSREDVVRMIDKICLYYAQQEPSSPIPLLLLRAQKLVNKSFMDILQDMSPESLENVRFIIGKQSDDE